MIQIVVLTLDEKLSTYVGNNKARMVGDDIRKKAIEAGQEISVNSLLLDFGNARDKLNEYLYDLIWSDDVHVLAFFDHRLGSIIKEFCSALFCVEFDLDSPERAQNYFRQISAKAVRQFLFYLSRFADEKFRRLINLPLRNFRADEVIELSALFCFVDEGNSEFPTMVDGILARLRKRQQPKRDEGYKDVYVVDDHDKYFIYGLERHSQIETKRPPHHHQCLPNANWRFGGKYDARRHYNVSKSGQRISGQFLNCHGVGSDVPPASHLNLFPNDFF